MQPRYIRFIVPSNTNSQLNVSSQGAPRFISLRPSICFQNSTPPLQIINKVQHATPATPAPRMMLSSTPETVNPSKEIVPEEITSPPVPVSTAATFQMASSSSTNMPLNKLNTTNAVSIPESGKSIFTFFVVIVSVAFLRIYILLSFKNSENLFKTKHNSLGTNKICSFCTLLYYFEDLDILIILDSNAATSIPLPKSFSLSNKRSRSPSLLEKKQLNLKKSKVKIKTEEIGKSVFSVAIARLFFL